MSQFSETCPFDGSRKGTLTKIRTQTAAPALVFHTIIVNYMLSKLKVMSPLKRGSEQKRLLSELLKSPCLLEES